MRSERDTARVVTVVVLVALMGLAPVAGATAADFRGTASDKSGTASQELGGGIDAAPGAAGTSATNSARNGADGGTFTDTVEDGQGESDTVASGVDTRPNVATDADGAVASASTGPDTDARSGTADDGVEESADSGNTLVDAYNVSVSTQAGSPVTGLFFVRVEEETTLSYSVVSGPDNGTVSTDGDSFTYTPSSGYEGTDSFTYQVNDSDGNTDTATVTVTVLDESPPETEDVALTSNGASAWAETWDFEAYPYYAIDGNDSTAWAGSDSITVDLGRNYSIDEIRVNAGNNTIAYNLRVSYEDIPVAGRQKVLENHVVRGEHYVSDESDSVSNITLGGRTARYLWFGMERVKTPSDEQYPWVIRSIDVYPVENASVSADNVSVSTRAGSEVSGAFLASDEENGTLSYSVVSEPDHGTVSVENGSFTYAPASGYEGTDSFTYQTSAPDGDTDTATVTVTVTDESPPGTENVATPWWGATTAAETWGSYNGEEAHPDNVIDGNDSTAWAGSDWIEVDLGRNYSVDELRVDAGNYTLGYDVLVSNVSTEPRVWPRVAENHVTRGDDYVSAESESVSNITLDGRTVRYIRLDMESTNAPPDEQWPSVIERIEVYPTETNDPPSAYNLSVSTRAGSNVSGEFFARDLDDDDENLPYSVVSGPDNGTVSVEDNSFVYAPAPEYEGTDSFTYRVYNSDGSTDTATVNVTILDETPPRTEDVAISSNTVVRADGWGWYNGEPAYPYYAFDGNDSTVWAGYGFIGVDLRQNYSVDEIRVNVGDNTLGYDVRVSYEDIPIAGRQKVIENHVTRGENYVSDESDSVSNMTLGGRTVRYILFDIRFANAPPDYDQYSSVIRSIEVYPAETSRRELSHRWNVSRDHRLQYAEVASDGGTVFAAGLGRNVTAYDDETGTVDWQFQREGSLVDSSPVASGDLVYVGSGSGTLYALDQADGSVVWTVETDSAIGSSPAVAGGTVYFAGNDGDLYAVDAATGDVDWQTSVDGFPSAGPVVNNGTVYVTTDDGTVAAHSADTGEERWSRALDGAIGHSGPTVADGSVVAAAGSQVYGLDAETGATQWNVSHGETPGASLTIARGTVYLGSASGTVRAIDVTTGETEWTRQASVSTRSAVSVVDGTVVFGTNNGIVRAVDAENGTERASLPIGGQVPTSAVLMDRSVYVGTWDGRVYALDSTG